MIFSIATIYARKLNNTLPIVAPYWLYFVWNFSSLISSSMIEFWIRTKCDFRQFHALPTWFACFSGRNQCLVWNNPKSSCIFIYTHNPTICLSTTKWYRLPFRVGTLGKHAAFGYDASNFLIPINYDNWWPLIHQHHLKRIHVLCSRATGIRYRHGFGIAFWFGFCFELTYTANMWLQKLALYCFWSNFVLSEKEMRMNNSIEETNAFV